MVNKISYINGQPNFEALTVLKITDYPLESADYKPFAQAILCLTPDSLVVQLWAFESHPSPRSSIAIVFAPDATTRFAAELISTGQLDTHIMRGGDEDIPFAQAGLRLPTIEPLAGEDLQGLYWGARLRFSLEDLAKVTDISALKVGGVLHCNVYKLSSDEAKPHCGALFPADFAHGQPFSFNSLKPLEIVAY